MRFQRRMVMEGPAGDRFERWRAELADSPIPLEVRPCAVTEDGGARGFHAVADVAALGELMLSRSRAGAHHLVRTPRLISAADEPYYSVNLHVAGACKVAVGERREILRPGMMALLTSERPTDLVHATDTECLVAHVPRRILPASGAFAQVVGVPMEVERGAASLLRGMMLQMSRLVHAQREPLPARLADTFLELLETAVLDTLGEAPAGRGGPRQALLAQVRHDIDVNLGSDRLSPAEIAARNHMSKRSLHKLFEDQEMGVSAWVRERRLQRCARDLSDPVLASVPIHQIAARWGLGEAARFSRMFKARFGVSPSDYRQARRAAAAAQASDLPRPSHPG